MKKLTLTKENIDDFIDPIYNEPISTDLNFEIMNKHTGERYHVTEIGDDTFSHSEIQMISFPKDLKRIGNHAFENSTVEGSEEIIVDDESYLIMTIPDSVTEIGDGAFSGCKNITNINIPNNVISLGKDVFDGCAKDLAITYKSYSCTLEELDLLMQSSDNLSLLECLNSMAEKTNCSLFIEPTEDVLRDFRHGHYDVELALIPDAYEMVDGTHADDIEVSVPDMEPSDQREDIDHDYDEEDLGDMD